MAEVDLDELIHEVEKEFRWLPSTERVFERIVRHLARASVLRKAAEKWYGEQLQHFPSTAYLNTLRLIARAFDRIVRECNARAIDIESLDLETVFETIADYDRERVLTNFVRDALQTIMVMRELRTEEKEATASELEKHLERSVSELRRELEELRELSPEAYARLREELARIAREMGIAERAENHEELRRRLAELEERLARLERELSEARTRAKTQTRARTRASEERGTCPGGEEPLPLDVVWGLAHEDATELRAEFRRWLIRNWDKLPMELKIGVFGVEYPPPPTRRETWEKLYTQFFDEFKRHFPQLATVLIELEQPVNILRFYALCPSNWMIYRLRITDGRTLERAVPETTVLRALRQYLSEEVAERLGLKVRWVGRRTPFGLGIIQFVVTPEQVYRAIGGRCPICGNPNLICNATDFGQTGYCVCPNCQAAFLYNPVTGEKEVRVPAHWDRNPRFRPEWLKKLRELEAQGWKVVIT